MHAAVNANGLEAHSQARNIQPSCFADNMLTKLKANHTNSEDRDVIAIRHVDKGIRNRLERFKITAVRGHVERTARVNTEKILCGGRHRASTPLEVPSWKWERWSLLRGRLEMVRKQDRRRGRGCGRGRMHWLVESQNITEGKHGITGWQGVTGWQRGSHCIRRSTDRKSCNCRRWR